MSYQLVTAKARSKGLDALWQTVDLSQVKISQLYLTYRQVWLTLSHQAVTTPLYLDMELVRADVSAQYSDFTVTEWLDANGNNSLPTQAALPATALKRVRYNDAWRAGYTIEPVDLTRSPNSVVPYGDRNDLLLKKGDLDFNAYRRYMMVSVNGYFHRTGGSVDGLQVLEGGRTGRHANDNQVGILSFREVATLDFIPITADMIYKLRSDVPFSDRAYINLPYSVENKTILMVIGGFLHVLDDTYTRIGPQSICVNFNRISFAERYMESSKVLDLTSLPLDRDEDNPNHVSMSQLFSDTVIKAYLSLPQSFIVVVNTDDFYARRIPIPNPEQPGRFEVPKDTERLPVFGPYGVLCDYAIFPDWGTHVLACRTNERKNYQFNSTHWRSFATIDDSLDTRRPWQWAQGQMIEMGRFS